MFEITSNDTTEYGPYGSFSTAKQAYAIRDSKERAILDVGVARLLVGGYYSDTSSAPEATSFVEDGEVGFVVDASNATLVFRDPSGNTLFSTRLATAETI